MTFRSRIVIAALVAALPAVGAVTAPQPLNPAVRDAAVWFPLSFEPIRQIETPLKPVDEPSTVSRQPSQEEVQVPATVQNLRRADR